jgi:trigger factor
MDTTLTTTSERLNENKAKLRVEVPESALSPALDSAYKRWAGEIRVSGFRKGKVPRQLIDARVGADTVRSEAIENALPDLYVEALRSEDLEAIAPPEIDIVQFDKGSPLIFEATVDLRPEVIVPELSSIEVEAPPSEVTDQDIDEQIERLRDRFAELETVSREARRGDHVLIDLKGTRNDQPVEGASSPDLLYELGSNSGPPKLDGVIEGNKPGAILRFNDVTPRGASEGAGEEISFTVLLKEVKTKKLPPVDDEFAKNAGEYDSVDELRAEIRERLGTYKQQLVGEQVRNLALEALVAASDLQSPEVLVDGEFNHRLEHMQEDLAQAGLSVEQYAAQLDKTELEFRSELREQVEISVKAELLLEEIARQQEINVSDEDFGREIAYIAARSEMDPKDVAKQLADGGRLRTVAADIIRRKALDHVVSSIEIEGYELPALDEEMGEGDAPTGGPVQTESERPGSDRETDERVAEP